MTHKPRTRISWRAMAPGVSLVFAFAAMGVFVAGANAGGETRYVVVRHVFSASPDGTLIIEEESRSEVSAQFVVNQHTWGAGSIPVPVSYNPAGEPDAFGLANLIQGAISTWNGAGSGFSFVWAGNSGGETGSCSDDIDTDGVNTIRFEDLGGLTLGQTCTIYPVGANTKLVEFDMQLDDDPAWSVSSPVPGNKYDLATTILHELGHAAGIGHSAESQAVMYFQIGLGENKRVLTDDDIAGIRAAYPAAATSTPTNTSTPTPTSVPPNPTATPTVAVPTLTPPALTIRVRAPLLARD